ncbi:efflux RND transporter periplasmic adaptor subunit [Pontibacter sp. Tf4]|uniref:efflux RND transporter periplasmic adaptor subunit n=1 Tax=Pontibacter sp. Tf4 TaxID=2761620 RepID=UPI0016254005|nr:efflux RND transporter periplasmic adaptor subunit [Pontibacter sp. Tf4]MBB6609712.1 efflux RND transporter periplasmic adaptor subunit [Pontibacter sp. Tf4]
METPQEHNAIHLTGRMKLLANIETDTARATWMGDQQAILGTVVIAENQTEEVSARVSGRLDKLFVRNSGEKILKGEALYALYSEELLIAENEYLNALELVQTAESTDQTMVQLLGRAKKRLQLWGLTENQIISLATTRRVDPKVTFYSPASGFITNLKVREGEYVAEGTPLMGIANLSNVWVEAQVYSNELDYLKAGVPVEIEFEGYPGQMFKGIPAFRSPALEKNSQVYLMRYKVLNPAGTLRPGMMAYVSLSGAKVKTLTVPKSALLFSEDTAVWVETSTDQFEMRLVKTGIENKDRVQVLKGLKEGEVVVTSGAYLLNSKNIIDKGATHTMLGM